jgi:cell division protein FtsQ
MSSSDQNYYIDKHGVHMPLSKKHTARILIATGFIEKASRDTDFEQQLFAVAEFIKKDQFLDALIGQIHVKYDGELILVPKIEDFKIEFGNLDNMEFKFKKLKIFYKEILPYEGWNKYNKVDLRFSNQIVLNKK